MAKTNKKTRRVAKTVHASRTGATPVVNPTSSTVSLESARMSFSQLLAAFILFTVTHSIIFSVASVFFPMDVVLGNHLVSALSSLLITSATLALISVGVTPLIESASEAMKTKLSNGQWMGLYLILNVLTIWVLARMAEEIGFGISSWLVAVILGLVINILQGVLIMSVVSRLANRSV
jgi:hypothetical protein